MVFKNRSAGPCHGLLKYFSRPWLDLFVYNSLILEIKNMAMVMVNYST